MDTLQAEHLGPKRAIQGEPQALSSLVRGRPTALAFFATYCPPCIEEMPLFNALAREGHAIAGVSLDTGNLEALATLLNAHSVRYPVALMTADSLKAAGRTLNGLPTTLIVDGAGTVREIMIGQVERRTLLEALARADR